MIYYQVDGGSENTAKAIFAMAELLVAKGICNQLFLTRLPVGHTHEDIDSKFSKIWMRLRDEHVSTMREYTDLIEKALCPDSNHLECEVIDIFVVPYYVSYLQPCMDKAFGRYARLEWTQLQWRFEKVCVSSDFPLGVKTMYRACSCDKVIEIIASNSELGYSARDRINTWQPKIDLNKGILVEGMYLLQCFPQGNLDLRHLKLDHDCNSMQHSTG